MNLKSVRNFRISSLIISAFALAIALTAIAFNSPTTPVSAQGKKEFKGARVEDDKLILKPGFKLRQVAQGRFETFREESSDGPTARRVTKPVRVDGINIKCVCGGTTNSSNCTTTVTGGGATCSTKQGCSKCQMIATE